MGQGLGVEVLTSPVVNYAMAHCGLAFLHRIVVEPPTGTIALDDVVVTADIVDAHGHLLTRPWRQHLESVRGDVPLVIDNPGVRLDPAAVAGLEEETTAEVVVTVTVGAGGIPGAGTQTVSHTPVRVLAARQWTIDPTAPVLSLEMLATFVQPNHPAVAPVVAQAATILEKHTGSGSLASTEVRRERRDAIVQAVFDAVFERDLHYIEAPASWGYGQKVRTPGDVLGGRLGTCLDTTITLASCLEHIGIAPVLWLARGHAFLGYWRESGLGLPDAGSLETGSAANAVDLERMGVVETTMVTRERRPPKDLFRRASQAPRDTYFQGRTGELVGVVDVGTARLTRILPVPARRVRDDGVVEIVEYHPPDLSTAYAASAAASLTPPAAMLAGAHAATRPPPPPRVQAWKNALLDLTLRNKLLNLSPPMTMAPLVTPSEQLGLLARILQEGRTISVRAVDDLSGAVVSRTVDDAYALPGDVQRSMLAQRSTIYSGYARDVHKAAMQRLRYRARTTLQETGANPLYLTLGRLDWRLGDRELSAPLLLAPVDIKGVVLPFRIAFDESGAVTLNHSLLEKLRIEHGFTVDGLGSSADLPTLPGSDVVDVDAVITRVREAIADSGLPFRVESEARLAIIAFTGYLLWRDLDQHWESFLERPLVRHLALSPSDSFSAGQPPDLDAIDLDEVVAGAPVPTDGAQAQAVASARVGASFVLEGPPGTGKSQTITGILADQMAQGRRVLFVAEKGAALDVVRNRLAEVGLLPFALDLHDENARPTEVRARLRTALASAVTPDEDGYRVAALDVAAAGRLLEGYAARVHAPNAAGLTLYSAHNQRLARGEGAMATVPPEAVSGSGSGSKLDDVRGCVTAAVPALASLGRTDCPAWGFALSRPGDLTALWSALDVGDAAVTEALRLVDAASPQVRDVVLGVSGLDDLEIVSRLISPRSAPVLAVVESRTARWQAALDELLQRSEALRSDAQDVLATFDPRVVGVSLEPVRQALREAAASFFIGRKGRLLAAAAPVLAHLRPGIPVEAKRLTARVDRVGVVAGHADAVARSWRALPGCEGLPTDLNLLMDDGWARAKACAEAVSHDRRLLDLLPPSLATSLVAARTGGATAGHAAFDNAAYGTTVHEALAATLPALGTVFALTSADASSIASFAQGRGLLLSWDATRPARSADRPRAALLGRWVEASDALAPLAARLPAARWELLTGAVGADEAPAAVERGLAAASEAERWESEGFSSFDVVRQDRTVAQFVSASARLRATLSTALPASLLGQRPFRPGALFGTVGRLEREIGRTRGGSSVRRLIEDYGEVIGAITPCVLVSPDSLARFIPPGAMSFDLVVFDEASQITVADAIGALGRADAAVIAGDSKQMPPSSFGQLAVEEQDDLEAEFQVVADEESILTEAVQAGVNRLWLSWHYRSQDESLIAFSNAAYYEDRLSSFPAHPAQVHDTGVSFTRVPGTFLRSRRTRTIGPSAVARATRSGPQDAPSPQDAPMARTTDHDRMLLRTNPVEAAAVVAEVLRRWSARERSIGIVTFNLQQRGLIEQLLWDSGVDGVAESLAARTDGLFVKNLENVQGDERDVIRFSTGFSVGDDGVLPLNFGPLNRSGGERRLNVAVTRARRRVMVFSSFDPEDLRVAETSSTGIRDLRRYLEFAKYGVAASLSAVSRVDGSSAAPAPSRIGVDRHRDEIAEALRAAGLEVQTAVGLSDFQIDLASGLPGQSPSLAVLLDSPAWAARLTTSDRDALPITVLEHVMGWPGVARVWLPAWLADREAVVADLVRATRAASDRPLVVGERVVVGVRSEIQDAPVDEAVPAPGGLPVGRPPTDGLPADELDPVRLGSSARRVDEEFAPYVTDVIGTRSALEVQSSPRKTALVGDLMRHIVEIEGPVSTGRLARLVGHAHGLTRVTEERAAELRRVVPSDLRRDPEEGFVWPESRDPLRWKGFRRYAGPLKERPLDEVALREIANALVFVADTAMGISLDELVKETYRLFGGNRVTPPVRARMETALAVATGDGRLAVTGGLVVPR
ncbi:DUF3320 domain-containing protein [Lapillicoccus sp.]|uniref:DUF3320 domain-containing protein n=1 Tax=Lapillicoccus sp. TaxID=1909287 RepID=UPI0025F941A1|nr:DUF3320 domain-containing protein [Lapillicoccus sp.]